MLGSMAGQAACLIAACLWAVAVLVFSRPIATHGAPAINLAKCLIATPLLALSVILGRTFNELGQAPARDLMLLAVSGSLVSSSVTPPCSRPCPASGCIAPCSCRPQPRSSRRPWHCPSASD